MAQIHISGLQKRYGQTRVIHGIDLEIDSGEFLVILGPSGCGKSTLLRMIAGLEKISAGELAIGGKVVNQMEPRERGCAMVFQNYALYPHMTVAENIGYALRVSGMKKAQRLEKIREVARMLELEPMLDRRPAELSGGQRQRVAMGRAMIREPRVFLFDEPLSNLDARLRIQMRAEIRRLHRRLSATSVFVTHDQVEAMTLADRMIVMNGGRVEQHGTPSEIYARPASRFVAEFIGAPAMNLVAGTVDADAVTLSDGTVLPVRPEGSESGSAITVGFRPEALKLVAPGTPGTVCAIVDFVEELGAGRVFHCEALGSAVSIMTSDPQHPDPGTKLGLRIPPEAVHFFDAKTGLRLEVAAAALVHN